MMTEFNLSSLASIMSFLVISPIISLYESYFISQKRTKRLAVFLIGTTILDILLNYFFITYGLKWGMLQAVLGAGISTIFTRFLYFLLMIFFKNKNLGIFYDKISDKKSFNIHKRHSNNG